MNYDRIRNMSDEELKKFLRNISCRDTNNCINCRTKATKVLKVYNLQTEQTKKMIGFCEKCYLEFLQKNDLEDILWN
ncbi:MAG: hypothetical protein UHK60_11115 [Acutalibacteraceae bacterium]|nr:hypothetical protein [Acutalibacteraceae bacterium]